MWLLYYGPLQFHHLLKFTMIMGFDILTGFQFSTFKTSLQIQNAEKVDTGL